MSPKKNQIPKRLKDPDFRNAEIALRRAAKRAKKRAIQAGYEPVIIKKVKTKEQEVIHDIKKKRV